MRRVFRGWWVTLGVFLTFGISVGIPYYNMPFFYDYYENAFHWPRHDITLGFPVAALLTLWVGPLVVPRFRPRALILAGTGLTFLAFLGFSRMSGSLATYYALWFVYTAGYILSGPIPHQIIISHWFRRKRGTAMGIAYVGVGLLGAAFSWAVKPLAEGLGFRTALFRPRRFDVSGLADRVAADSQSPLRYRRSFRRRPNRTRGTSSACALLRSPSKKVGVLAPADRQRLFHWSDRSDQPTYETRLQRFGIR